MQGCHLVNVEERHQQKPLTFQIGPRSVRAGLCIGDFAKIILELDHSPPRRGPAGERPWVEVVEVKVGKYVGRLDNTPVVVTAELGEEIEFGPEHVADYELRCQLIENVPSLTVRGYEHPKGRHASLVRYVDADTLEIYIHTFDRGEGTIVVDAETHMWDEKLIVARSAVVRPVEGPDPLDPRQFLDAEGNVLPVTKH